MIFFYCKGFAGIFFSQTFPSPLKDQIVHPLEEPTKNL